ncbi:RICIN domain-containing protein [Nonomuraea sp. NPDC052129]|uniref:RICIN domain-containing protein n=1 Tax=Nonomuraea sp. NPDC052129 TaxID=3154651 RepID=UPI0034400A39
MLPARRLLAGALASAALTAITALPATASAQPPTGHTAARTALAGPPMCIDATNDRTNGTQVRLWQCMNHANQKFVIDESHIKVEDTFGTSREVCLDAGNDRTNDTKVRLWQCMNHANQRWIIKNGEIILKDTLTAGNPMCLDVGNTRNNGDKVRIWRCSNHANQKFVIDESHIKVKDTLS